MDLLNSYQRTASNDLLNSYQRMTSNEVSQKATLEAEFYNNTTGYWSDQTNLLIIWVRQLLIMAMESVVWNQTIIECCMKSNNSSIIRNKTIIECVIWNQTVIASVVWNQTVIESVIWNQTIVVL